MSSEVAGHAPRVPVAVVPTAPLLLPAVSPRQPAALTDAVTALRADVTATLKALPDVALVVALAGGPRSAVHHGRAVDRTGSGHPQATTTVVVDRAAATGLATATGLGTDDRDVLGGDVGVLAALLAAARPTTPVVAVTVAPDLDLAALAHDLVAWAVAHRAAVVAAGDLSATRDVTSPGYVAEGAVAFDDAVVAALRAGDATALHALGAAEAERVQARGWAAVTVAALIAATPFAAVDLVAPRGVGQLVARTAVS